MTIRSKIPTKEYKENWEKIYGEKGGNKVTDTLADLESRACDELLGAQEVTRFDRPVDIHIHSRRKRLTDPDGCSSKYVIDGLVTAGILADDTANEIKSLTYSQEKVTGNEETIITIKECIT